MKTLFWGIAFLVVEQAFAWGHFGHRVIGAVAERNLCPKAAVFAQDLLDGQSMAEAAIWADQVRMDPEYNRLKFWHFVGINKGQTYETSKKHGGGDIVTAVTEQVHILYYKEGSKKVQREAFKMIIHFVGDAHQPLHAGRRTDMGGNRIYKEWFGQPTTLHWIWDTGLLKALNLGMDEIVEMVSLRAKKKFVPLRNPVQWVNESARIAEEIYTSEEKRKNLVNGEKLSQNYLDRNLNVVTDQIAKAGLRIADITNRLAGCD